MILHWKSMDFYRKSMIFIDFYRKSERFTNSGRRLANRVKLGVYKWRDFSMHVKNMTGHQKRLLSSELHLLKVFHDLSIIFINFHWFLRHFWTKNQWYLDRKLRISMKHSYFQWGVAPSSVNRCWCPDMFLIRTSRDLCD